MFSYLLCLSHSLSFSFLLYAALTFAYSPSWTSSGPTLLEFIDSFRAPDRYFDRPVRFVVFDKYKDMGSTVLAGKVEAGVISPGDSLILMPNSVGFFPHKTIL